MYSTLIHRNSKYANQPIDFYTIPSNLALASCATPTATNAICSKARGNAGTTHRGSMQHRVHATEGPCNVPCQASAHACTARALASPALASPVLIACARLHAHILRSAHLHPHPHTARLPLKGTKTSSNTATARSIRSRRKIPRPSGR